MKPREKTRDLDTLTFIHQLLAADRDSLAKPREIAGMTRAVAIIEVQLKLAQGSRTRNGG